MAKCGINTIPIGDKSIPAQRIVQALDSAKGIKDIDTAIAKSYDALPEGVSFDAWDKWFKSFMEPTTSKNITEQDITKAQTSSQYATKLKNLLNLAEYQPTDDFVVGDYAKRVFNRVKSNLLARGKGLTDDEIIVMTKSLKSVLTKDKINQDMNKLRSQAKKNLSKKLGANKELRGILNKVFSVFPEAVPSEKIDAYQNLLQEFGQRKEILTTRKAGEVFAEAQEFLNGLDDSLFAKKEKAEAQAGEIPKEVYVKQIKNKKISSENLSNPHEVEAAKELSKFKDEDFLSLDEKQLGQLVAAIDSINNGIFPPKAMDIIIDMRANRDVAKTAGVVKGIKPTTWKNYFSRTYGKVKAAIRKTNAPLETIRANPLTVVDEVFGGKGKTLYNATFGKLASAYSNYTTEAKGIQVKLDKAEEALQKQVGTGNRLAKAKFLMKIYQIQKEYEANQGLDDMYPAIDWVNKTIEEIDNIDFYDINSQRILEDLIAQYAPDGQFSADAIYSKLGKAEKDALAVMEEINENLVDKVLFTSGVMRGQQAKLYSFYTHHNAITSGLEADQLNTSRKTNFLSTKAGTVVERTPGVKAISFDSFYDVHKSATGLLLDHHMTPVNREVLRIAERIQEQVKDSPADVKLGAKALRQAIHEVLENVFSANNTEYSGADQFVNDARRLGYYATLASGPRAVAELASNLSFVLGAAPTQFAAGTTTLRAWSMAKDGALILRNLGSTQTGKLYEGGIEGSKFVEAPIAENQRKATKGVSNFQDSVAGAKETILKYSGVKLAAKATTTIAEALISTPDKLISRPVWYGGFAEAFKKEAGVDVDFQKIKDGDQAYMDRYSEALKKATQTADQLSVMAGATNNPFNSVLKIQEKKHVKGISNTYRILSGYLQRFLLFEYSTAKTAVTSLMGEGYLTRKQAAGVLAGVTTRMALYGTVYAIMSDLLAEALGFEGEDDEDEDWGKMLRNDLVGSILTLMFTRNLTSFPKVPINAAIEAVNKDFVGEGYDPYKDSIVFSQIGEQDFSFGKSFYDFLSKFFGPYGPPTKGLNSVWKEIGKYQKAKPSKKGDVLEDVAADAALQTMGYTGILPFFKDILKIYKQEKYRKKKKAKSKSSDFDLDLDLDLDVDLDIDN